MSIYSFTLPNGLRVVQSPSPSHVLWCGIAVDAGTRDEEDGVHGLAHFVEHNLFKGTQRRRACHILNRMEAVGGELNAYTTKEETVVYSVCLTGDAERAVELLSDLVFNSRFPEEEIVKEREVVADEIDSYEDNPAELVFDEFENLIFSGSCMGHNVLGTKASVARLERGDCLRFTKRLYRPERMVFFVLGNIPPNRLRRIACKYLADDRGEAELKHQRNSPIVNRPCRHALGKTLHQNHVVVGGRACTMFDDDRTALQLLNNLLGGPGMNSRLNLSLREKRGLVYTVESNLTLLTDCGLLTVYFGCDPADTVRCLDLVRREMQKLRDRSLTGSQFSAAVKQWKGQIGIADSHLENKAMSLGKRFMRYGCYDGLDTVFRRIDRLTPQALQDAARRYLDWDEWSVLTGI
jgi:predicted Zn-dependent peptidase